MVDIVVSLSKFLVSDVISLTGYVINTLCLTFVCEANRKQNYTVNQNQVILVCAY